MLILVNIIYTQFINIIKNTEIHLKVGKLCLYIVNQKLRY